MNTSTLPKLALIAGPTASGKSALALALAERHRGTIINADSAQVYADLRILSARPSAEDEGRVPHRLFGHVDGADNGYSAARWAGEARAAIAEAHDQARLPILVGGTGLYLRTLLDGIAPVPEIDATIRAEVRAGSVTDNFAELGRLDPAAAARLRAADTTRIARALEVVRSTGRPLLDWQSQRNGGIAGEVDLSPIILLPDRDWLIMRCDARFDAMLDSGAVDEVRRLMARDDVPPLAPVRRAIGVTEITRWLEGRSTLEATSADAKIATRRYAKRQYTWFRNQSPAGWLRTDETDISTLCFIIETKLLD